MMPDILSTVRFWGSLFLVGAAGYPLARRLFGHWYDQGYFLSKALGLAVITYLVWFMATLRIMPFTVISIYLAMAVLFLSGAVLYLIKKEAGHTAGISVKKSFKSFLTLASEELFFLGALLFWSYIKAHEPTIHGLEKFMDYGFTKSILNSTFFPAPDIWYAGSTINYYYFGHTVMAMLTKLSGLDLSVAFNLMLSTLFALCATMSFGIGFQLLTMGISRKVQNLNVRFRNLKKILLNFSLIAGGLFTSFLVTLSGNMQTLYAFTQGYTGEDVKPFWELFWPWADFWSKLPEGLERYWYANATRFIPFTIHEFPAYSFVVSDVHGHVLSIPFALLALAFLINNFGMTRSKDREEQGSIVTYLMYGFMVAVLFMTNALDGPIYLGLFIILSIIIRTPKLITDNKIADLIYKNILVFSAGPFLLPFLSHFRSFANAIGINCPPANLANSKFGLFVFEEVTKCQHSPLWMSWLLWGFFIYTGLYFIFKGITRSNNHGSKRLFNIFILNINFTQYEKVFIVFFFYSLGLLIFPEIFYFRDIYPAHFRSNTMFKLGYQAFMMLSIISGYTIVRAAWVFMRGKQTLISHITNKIFLILLLPQLFLVCIFPVFAVRSYFDSLKTYWGLDGTMWIKEQYPDDYEGISWLNDQFNNQQPTIFKKIPVIVEADGDSYSDYARYSAFTGFSTVIGWPVHEWLWRGSYDIVAPRREEVREIYENIDINRVHEILNKYSVDYIIIGILEREKFNINEERISQIADPVFISGSTAIYAVRKTGTD